MAVFVKSDIESPLLQLLSVVCVRESEYATTDIALCCRRYGTRIDTVLPNCIVPLDEITPVTALLTTN